MSLDSLYLEGDNIAPANVGGQVGQLVADKVPGNISPKEASADLTMVQQQLAIAQQQVDQYKTLSDQLLNFTVAGAEATQPQDPEAILDEFEKDPQAVIRREAERLLAEREKTSDPATDEVKQRLDELMAKDARESLSKEVEDYTEVFKNPEFQTFLEENPTYKQVLAIANQEYDVNTIAGVLNHFKTTQGGGNASSKRIPTNSPSKGGGGGSGRVFSREAIKKLSIENPTEFAKLSGEIAQAYKEGRVK